MFDSIYVRQHICHRTYRHSSTRRVYVMRFICYMTYMLYDITVTIGKYRALFRVYEEEKTIVIVKIDLRRRIYG